MANCRSKMEKLEANVTRQKLFYFKLIINGGPATSAEAMLPEPWPTQFEIRTWHLDGWRWPILLQCLLGAHEKI